MAGKRPIGSAPVKYDRSRVPAPRRREASQSEEPSERSRARSEDADREEEEQARDELGLLESRHAQHLRRPVVRNLHVEDPFLRQGLSP